MIPVVLGTEAVTYVVGMVGIPIPIGGKSRLPDKGNIVVIHGREGFHGSVPIVDSETVAGIGSALRII